MIMLVVDEKMFLVEVDEDRGEGASLCGEQTTMMPTTMPIIMMASTAIIIFTQRGTSLVLLLLLLLFSIRIIETKGNSKEVKRHMMIVEGFT